MLARYSVDKKGRKRKVADIFVKEEHNIDKSKIPPYVFQIVKNLKVHGFEAYVVGGAVRDLLLGEVPKDYDIVTDATPGKIKKIFQNSRIIGRRFKLVHLYYNKDIVEVSTFRSNEADNFFNVYGSIEDDVTRRDFSVNALYYCPEREWVIDYVEGVKDLRRGVLRSLIDLNKTFKQDPVRIIRAIKYSQISNLQISRSLAKAIVQDSYLLASVSPSRLVEELYKILNSKKSSEIFKLFLDFNIVEHFLPNLFISLKSSDDSLLEQKFLKSLKDLDSSDQFFQQKRYYQICMFLEALIIEPYKKVAVDEMYKNYFKQIKNLIYPLTPPNADVEKAVIRIMKNQGLNYAKKSRGHRGKKQN
ncbi:MAG: hypothetical protein JXR63_13635 [Spirochaetales bacterium]|nr:hypothetical protein [Spirochaetales bacterium]